MLRNARSIARWVLAVVFAGLLIQPVLAEKIKIEKMDDLPRYTYKIDMKAVELFDNEEALMKLAMEVKRDLLADLEKYDILDNNTLQDYYSNLGTIAILEGDWDKYLEYLAMRRELETKEANRLTMGILGEAVAKAQLKGKENYEQNVRKFYKDKVESLPYSIVQDNLKSAKGSSEIISKNLIFGGIEASIQPTLDESDGVMSQDMARGLIGTPFTLNYYLPIKDMVFEVLSAVIDANFVEKADIWADRDYALADGEGKGSVVLCVWDSGVDANIYKKTNQMWTNTQEIPDNGKDDDNNGFVDDFFGIGYDLKANKEVGCLYPIGEMNTDEELLRRQLKGLEDIQSNIDSEEASELKAKLATLEQDQVKPFIEGISIYGNYCHGTHVAGITANGNPNAKILVSRMTFDHKMIPETPTIEQAEREAKQMTECVDYYKTHGVRAVNMSWGGSLRSIEGALEANNAGGTPEERKALARRIYEIGDAALREAIAGAPEILFITSAGNADNDVTFEEFYPSSYDYPNIMSVGAVDQAGEETSFTSLGKVDVYANGFEVMSYVPGGFEMKLSGTSMSSPQITNLAGKLLALNPDLTAVQLRQLIIDGADEKDLG
ncbi:S8 family serine peptidase, partial [bacterium]|nr:S8 family serine peptidase [bacterium]